MVWFLRRRVPNPLLPRMGHRRRARSIVVTGLAILLPIGVSVGLISFGALLGAPGLPKKETLGDWSVVVAGICFFTLASLIVWRGSQLVLGRDAPTATPAHLRPGYRVGRTCAAFVRKFLPGA